MNRPLCGLAACVLAATQATAAPKLEPLREGDRDAAQFCPFVATRAGTGVVLELKYWEAKMRLGDTLVRLSVTEKPCVKNCVRAGRSGVRVFEMSGPGVTATLTKKVVCGRDAEVCAGLQEGRATLAVSTAAGRTAMSIWGEHCDM